MKERWRRGLGGIKSMYTLARCRKFVPGFNLPGFKADVLRLYEDVCRGIAEDDLTTLRQAGLSFQPPQSLCLSPLRR